MRPDLTNKRWIVAKGLLFAFLALLAGALQLLADLPIYQELALLLICVWASCRFYYFLFHCLQAYVDPTLKSAGVMDLVGRIRRRRYSAGFPTCDASPLIHETRLKFPEIKRTEELDHFSHGWPSLSETEARSLRISVTRISIYLTLAALALAILGSKVMADLLPAWLVVRIACQQLAVPVFLLLLEGFIGYCVFCGKRFPFWIVLFGWTGAFGMPWGASEGSHEISHELFESCSGYSEWLIGLAVFIAFSITATWLLEFRFLRGGRYAELKMTPNIRRTLGVLSILAFLLGVLYFLEII